MVFNYPVCMLNIVYFVSSQGQCKPHSHAGALNLELRFPELENGLLTSSSMTRLVLFSKVEKSTMFKIDKLLTDYVSLAK